MKIENIIVMDNLGGLFKQGTASETDCSTVGYVFAFNSIALPLTYIFFGQFPIRCKIQFGQFVRNCH